MEKEEVELLIQKLAAAIADKIKPAVPFEHQLWTTEEIAAYLKVSTSKVYQRYASLPDFPGRIELPTSEGRRSHPRWKAIEVIEWVEGYKPGWPKWR